MSSLSATKVSSWAAACATVIANANITTGYVGQFGNPMPEFTNYTWGIDSKTCYEYCGKGNIYEGFNFNIFAGAFTSWLLPWLALTAQLPFEAKSSLGNLMSLYMAVGSPALITYSLTISILNRIWVRRKFELLLNKLDRLSEPPQHFHKRLGAAQYLLQESQQVPMRASQSDGWLSSLVVLKDNAAWWNRVKKDLQNSRRGYTFSLVAQIGMAFLAYLFTMTTNFDNSTAGNSEGTQVLVTAGGSLWIWMIPVIWGWIMCGTQAFARSITDALEDKTHLASRIDEQGKIVHNEMQYGILSRSGLIPLPPLDPSKPLGHVEDSTYVTLGLHTWFGFSLQGDEAREGPLFNYARLFTFRQFATTVTEAFDNMLANSANSKGGQGQNRDVDLFKVASSCNLERPLQAYTPWAKIDSVVWHHLIIAAGAAIFVQWGTTGPAVMMGYLTPTVGLGCRSGSYLIYGVGGTVSWALLVCSSLFSHAAALQYQEIYEDPRLCRQRKKDAHVEDGEEGTEMNPNDAPARDSNLIDLSAHVRTPWQSTLAFLTVATRVTGKLIAAVNACWIVVSAIFEYTGVYSSCWCETDADVFGFHSYAIIFVTPIIYQEVTINYWVGGFVFSFFVCFLAYLGFYYGCKRSDVNEYDESPRF